MLLASIGLGISVGSHTYRCHNSDRRLVSVSIAIILLATAAGFIMRCSAVTVTIVVVPRAACVGMVINPVYRSCTLRL